MRKDELVSGFILELRRGTVILAVLSKLRQKTYGYGLVGALAESGVAVEANTLYPLLRRLEGQGLLQSEWNTDAAKPRKYYRTTPFGDEVFLALSAQWRCAVNSMNALLQEACDE